MITGATLFERFAGRDEELTYLVSLSARARREVRGGVVSIAGDAGVGKSRLLTEFERATASERGLFVRVRCEEFAVAYAPFVAVLEALGERRELRGSDEIAAARVALTVTDEAPGLDGVERSRSRSRALLAALGFAARRLGNVTLAFDDTHWSDLSSLEAMRLVAGIAGTQPLVLAFTYRPGDLASDSARANAIIAIEREGADRIALDPLAYAELHALLRRTIPNAPPSVLRRIYDLSEGKPYVAEELARSVVERGDVDFEPTLSLRSAVLDRVARLEPEGRDIIRRAAVLGRNFAPSDLRALGAADGDLFATFRAAVDLQLVEERVVEGKPWFRFRHALTREILYRDLLGMERRALHAACAEHLEASGNRTAELAYHLAAAGDTTRALAANERAGDEAMGLAAFADAAALFTRALEFAREGSAEHGALARKLAEALQQAVRFDELVATGSHEADRLARCGRDEDAIAVLMIVVRTVAPTRFAEALPLLERAKALAERSRVTPDLRFTLELLDARVLRLQARSSDALAACARAEAVLEQPTIRQYHELWLSQAQTYLRLNDLANAARALERRLAHRPEDHTDADEAQTVAALAMVAYRRGDIRSAFAKSLEAATLWKRAGNERHAQNLECNAAYYASELGDFAFVERTVERLRNAEAEPQQALAAARIRSMRAVGGDPEPFAEQFARELVSGTPYLIYMLGRDLAWMLADDPQRARAIVRAALDAIPAADLEADLVEAVVAFGSDEDVTRAFALSEEGAWGPDDALHAMDAAMANARLAVRRNRPLEARDHADRARDAARRSGHWLTLAHAHALCGDREAARAEFERVGALAELARFERRRPASDAVHVAKKLTSREEQIARLIVAGLTNRQTAERLAIAPRTVETHVANVYQKLAVTTRAELAALFASEDSTGPA